MIDPFAFRKIMGCFATGISVITLRDGASGKAVGLTVNSLTSVSLTPPLLLFCLDKKAHLHPAFSETDGFIVNLLAADQENVSRYFADFHHNPEPQDLWIETDGQPPRLKHSLGWLHCKPYAVHQAGDHDIFVGEVVAAKHVEDEIEPLLYFRGKYRAIKPV